MGRVSNLALREVCPLLPVHVLGTFGDLENFGFVLPYGSKSPIPSFRWLQGCSLSVVSLRRNLDVANVLAAVQYFGEKTRRYVLPQTTVDQQLSRRMRNREEIN